MKQHSGRERREREFSFRPSEFLVSEEQPPLPSWVRLSLGEQGFVSGHQHRASALGQSWSPLLSQATGQNRTPPGRQALSWENKQQRKQGGVCSPPQGLDQGFDVSQRELRLQPPCLTMPVSTGCTPSLGPPALIISQTVYSV